MKRDLKSSGFALNFLESEAKLDFSCVVSCFVNIGEARIVRHRSLKIIFHCSRAKEILMTSAVQSGQSSIWVTVLTKLSMTLALASSVLLSGCGYNEIQSSDEGTKAAWSEVLNQYKRRADLIPNLVKTVQGYAQQEKDVFIAVTEARSKVGQVQVNPSDPASLKQFEAAQKEMGSALSRLLVVSENYPQLKSDANFRDLQAQLEGTENRITVARKRYIETVQSFNTLVRQFPTNLMAMAFGYAAKPQFTVDDEKAIQQAPAVDFGTKPAGK
jgi:LemA protein